MISLLVSLVLAGASIARSQPASRNAQPSGTPATSNPTVYDQVSAIATDYTFNWCNSVFDGMSWCDGFDSQGTPICASVDVTGPWGDRTVQDVHPHIGSSCFDLGMNSD
jgi:hypothetical protein